MVPGLQKVTCGATQLGEANRGWLGTEDSIDIVEESGPNDPVGSPFTFVNDSFEDSSDAEGVTTNVVQWNLHNVRIDGPRPPTECYVTSAAVSQAKK